MRLSTSPFAARGLVQFHVGNVHPRQIVTPQELIGTQGQAQKHGEADHHESFLAPGACAAGLHNGVGDGHGE